MAKITLQDITSGYDAPTRINSNNGLIEAAVENTLSRDGTAPNQMEYELDMNSHRIINVAAPVAGTDAARLIDLSNIIPAGSVTTGNASGTIGLTAVAGSGNIVALANSTPALSQAIAPTWTATHTFTQPVVHAGGSAAAPGITFSGALTDGIARLASNILLLVTNGVERLRVTTTAIQASLAFLFSSSGTASAPSIAPAGDTNTGFYPSAADDIGIAAGGSQVGAIRTAANGALHTADAAGTLHSVGYKLVPQNSQSASYTCVAADSQKHIYHPSGAASGHTYTIPANASVAYPIGTTLTFVNMSTNTIQIAITTDTMYLASAGSTGTRTLAQYGIATAVKLTSTTWLINGSGLT